MEMKVIQGKRGEEKVNICEMLKMLSIPEINKSIHYFLQYIKLTNKKNLEANVGFSLNYGEENIVDLNEVKLNMAIKVDSRFRNYIYYLLNNTEYLEMVLAEHDKIIRPYYENRIT
jgi:hypothetical protein